MITAGPNHYRFTGKERDAESGADYFGARYSTSSLGRWYTPDWSGVPVPVPYAVVSNPQTLNLYAFVQNDPVSRADLDGHDGLTFLGIPIVYNCSPFCSEEMAHEIQHAKDYYNPKLSLAQKERRAFAAEVKAYDKRVGQLEKKQASGKPLTPAEQKELHEIQKERLPAAQNGATMQGARDYVRITNPGADPDEPTGAAATRSITNAANNLVQTVAPSAAPAIQTTIGMGGGNEASAPSVTPSGTATGGTNVQPPTHEIGSDTCAISTNSCTNSTPQPK